MRFRVIATLLVMGLLFTTGCGTTATDGVSTGNGSGNDRETGNRPNQPSLTENGIFTYKNLQWQDDESVPTSRVAYSERDAYCKELTLGGYNDWRVPTVSEYKELNEVKDKMNFAWSEENYIFWTSHDYTAGAKEYVSMFNLANGLSPQYIVALVGNDEWGIRCVRDKDGSSAAASDSQSETTTGSKVTNLFQSLGMTGSYATTVLYIKDNAPSTTLKLSNTDGTFRFGTSSSETTGTYDLFSGDTIHQGETLLILSQNDIISGEKKAIYTITYLGGYKEKGAFVRILHHPTNESYISILHPYRGNQERLLQEADEEYGSIEEMYNTLFHTTK